MEDEKNVIKASTTSRICVKHICLCYLIEAKHGAFCIWKPDNGMTPYYMSKIKETWCTNMSIQDVKFKLMIHNSSLLVC
jgi:hypothetical protein